MAHSKGIDLRRSQEDRGLAPAQVAAFTIAAFLAGIAAAGGGISTAGILLASFAAGVALFAWKRSWFAGVLIPLACLTAVLYYHSYFLLRAARTSVPLETTIGFSGI